MKHYISNIRVFIRARCKYSGKVHFLFQGNYYDQIDGVAVSKSPTLRPRRMRRERIMSANGALANCAWGRQPHHGRQLLRKLMIRKIQNHGAREMVLSLELDEWLHSAWPGHSWAQSQSGVLALGMLELCFKQGRPQRWKGECCLLRANLYFSH